MQFLIKSTPQAKRLVFNAIKEKILKHLEELEKQESTSMQKALSELTGLMFKGGKGLPVGTIREWKGKKFIKTAPGKWKPKYDTVTRGARMSVAAIKRKVESCEDAHQMMQILIDNKDRFSDEKGEPLRCVQELSDFIDQTKESKTAERQKKEQKIARQKKQEPAAAGTKKKAGQSGVDGSGGGDEGSGNDGYPEKDYPEYKGTGQKAVDFIVKQKGGQVRGAFNRPEIGDIDVVWGKVTNAEKHKGYGLAHIIDKHGNEIVNKIEDIIKNGKIEIQENKIATIFYQDFKLGLSRGWNGKGANHWILTAYQKDKDTGKTFDAAGQSSKAALSEIPTTTLSQSEKKAKSGIEKIKAQYTAKPHITGDKDEIYVGDRTLTGMWKLVEADAPSASHDEKTFQKTEGFPENADGSTINDRDYENDRAAQEAVISVAGKYDGRALSFDTPVVVTQDGVVVSGNNRTMSSKLAADKGTDNAYIEALKKRAKKFGFTAEDLSGFKHPRVVFEIQSDGSYSTEQFAQFNVSETKTMNPVELKSLLY